MAKLTPDYIQFVLSLSTDQAQQEIHKLEKASSELKSENKELRKSMAELTATGRRNSDEYRNLEEQYKRNNRAIAENTAKTNELLRSINIQNKSYKQLSQEAKRLQRELDNTVKALEPERYAELSDQLEDVKKRMNELRGTSTNLKDSFFSLNKIKTTLAGAFAQVGYAVTQSIGEAIGKVKEFARESINLAVSADGVTHAFEQLGRSDLLASLREQTKGTVSDLQLMTALVKARDFRIPLDEMGKFLAFAQLKAQQTGQSIDYMVDSIVTGLGRQSLLILDNLGLSAAEIKEKIAETGDFMQGVGVIVEKQLQQAGMYISEADKVAAADVRMQNAKLKLGKALSWLGDLQLKFKNSMAELINSTLSTANDKYEEQKAKVIALATETEPLVDRYEELRSKISLTATEQDELNGIIARIAQTIPSAVSQIGAYGKALDINSEQARKFIETQKQLMLYDNRKAIAEAEKNIREYQKKFARANSVIQNQGRSIYTPTSTFGTGQYIWDNSPETLERATAEASQYRALIDRENDRLKELRGENLESLIENQQKQREAREEFLRMNRAQLEAWLKDEKNAQSEYRDMAQSFLATKATPTPDSGDKSKKKGKKSSKKFDVTERYPQYKGTFTTIQDDIEIVSTELFNMYQEQDRLADYVCRQVIGSSSLIADLFANASEKSMSEIQAIIDKTEQLFYYLRGGSGITRGQILSLGISEKQLELLEKSPEEVKALGDALKKIRGELGSRSPFLLLEDQLGKAIEKLRSGDLAGGIEGIGNAVQDFAPALTEFGESIGALFGNDDVSNKIKGITDAFGGMGQTAAGVGRIMAGDIAGGAMSAAGGISKLVGAISSLFGADYSEYNEMVEKYEELLGIWDELLDAKRAYIQESYGAQAIKAGEEALNITKNQLEVEKKLAEIRLSSGKSIGSHSLWYRMWKGSYKWEGQNWRDVAGEVENGLANAGLGNVSFTQMESFLQMSSEQLQWIKENYAGLWSVMDGEFREHLENIIEFGNTEQEILEAVKAQMTGITFEEFENSYIDMLLDLDSSNEDFANDFEKKLQQAILRSVIASKYKNEIKKLYDTWAGYGEDGYTPNEVDQLKEMQQNLTESMLQEREQLASLFGWSADANGNDSSTQTASRGSFESMRQETGEELNGRFTAVQQSAVNLERLVESLLQENGANLECITEIRDILYESNGYLGKIETYARSLSSMRESLDSIKENIKNI